MTAFDDELLGVVAVVIRGGNNLFTAADLADTMDASDDSVRRAVHRLAESGRLNVFHNPGSGWRLELPGGSAEGSAETSHPLCGDPEQALSVWSTQIAETSKQLDHSKSPSDQRFRAPGGFAETPQPPAPPLKGGEGPPGTAAAETQRTPPGHAEKSTGPRPRPPNPHCPRCEGTGWQFTDRDGNTVAPCDCRGPEAVGWSRGLHRQRDASWGSARPLPPGPPIRSQRIEDWRAYARGQIDGADVKPPELPDERLADIVPLFHPSEPHDTA